MTDEFIQGRREINTIIDLFTHTVVRTTSNYAELPLSDSIIANISHSLTVTSDNYVYLPTTTTVVSGITHAVTIENS